MSVLQEEYGAVSDVGVEEVATCFYTYVIIHVIGGCAEYMETP